ncbi:MAG: hypothetical protein ACRED5_16655, partial [Propylenella sp.]
MATTPFSEHAANDFFNSLLGVEAMKVVHPGRGCEVGVANPTNPEPEPRMNIHKNARMTVH